MTVGCEMDDQMTFPPIGLLCYLKIGLALRNLIVQRCTVHGIPYDSPENTDSSVEALAAAMHSKAVNEANRATATLLVHQLTSGSQGAKTVAARGMRLLAKTRRENLSAAHLYQKSSRWAVWKGMLYSVLLSFKKLHGLSRGDDHEGYETGQQKHELSFQFEL
ncbi:hypothetical protein NC653_000177 [Populus alba x Populus x berolinensis]|uniref:Uncharacterized protein n=1 Tax=Populus alba x Populus x berolinensis TaxID=444605 RepID=A0AAD6WGB9_9ROSI|nr:hypothetical protein NC653_000177 [Populus alba x Populus x berolinensis]